MNNETLDLFYESAATYNGQTAWGDGSFLEMLKGLIPIIVQLIPMCFPAKELKQAAIVSVRELTRKQLRQMDATATQNARAIVREKYGNELGVIARIQKVRSLSEAAQNCVLYQCETASDKVLGDVFDQLVAA